MTPVRVRIDTLPDGTRRVSVGCSCARLGRIVPAWENVLDVIAELKARHRRESPTCPHPWLDR